MRFIRKGRRRQQEKLAQLRAIVPAIRVAAWWMLPATLAATALAYTVTGTTYALLSANSHPRSTAQFSALSTRQALAPIVSPVDLGEVTADQPVEQHFRSVLQNISSRTLTIAVRLEGVKGLTAVITPSHLRPGQTADIQVTGSVAAPGHLQGRLYVEAFDGFLSLELPLLARVVAPPPPPPRAPTECSGGGSATDVAPAATHAAGMAQRKTAGKSAVPKETAPPSSDTNDAPCGPQDQVHGPGQTPSAPQASTEPGQTPSDAPASPEPGQTPAAPPASPDPGRTPSEPPALPEQLPPPHQFPESPSPEVPSPAPEEQLSRSPAEIGSEAQ